MCFAFPCTMYVFNNQNVKDKNTYFVSCRGLERCKNGKYIISIRDEYVYKLCIRILICVCVYK